MCGTYSESLSDDELELELEDCTNGHAAPSASESDELLEDDDDEANNNPYIQEFMARPETSLEKNGGHDNNTISEAPSDETGSNLTHASFTISRSPSLSEQVSEECHSCDRSRTTR